jgi:hypothetical protein
MLLGQQIYRSKVDYSKEIPGQKKDIIAIYNQAPFFWEINSPIFEGMQSIYSNFLLHFH